jgi:heme exporter protein C
MRMRAIIAEAQVEARLKRRALDEDAPRTGSSGEPAMGGA